VSCELRVSPCMHVRTRVASLLARKRDNARTQWTTSTTHARSRACARDKNSHTCTLPRALSCIFTRAPQGSQARILSRARAAREGQPHMQSLTHSLALSFACSSWQPCTHSLACVLESRAATHALSSALSLALSRALSGAATHALSRVRTLGQPYTLSL